MIPIPRCCDATTLCPPRFYFRVSTNQSIADGATLTNEADEVSHRVAEVSGRPRGGAADRANSHEESRDAATDPK